eukprot:TRINITY_DN15237_c0_g1_i1.p1 TRINITY_DN15237_c0_g1~~TRINITY_DN15237_c0_g1_i1.p1  ORF type:complete len:767 (+),score=120.86 TRINITY_DN15237_c0_g1_i1:158-2302(+)
MAPGFGFSDPCAGGSSVGDVGGAADVEDDDAPSQAARDFRSFLEKSEGSSLNAWLRHFDKNNDHRITINEFNRGMRKMNFLGDTSAVFSMLDLDHSGELSLDEIDASRAALWRKFRSFCVATFENATDMVSKLAGPARRHVERLDVAMFTEGLQHNGWDGSFEAILFSAIDIEQKLYIDAAGLKWLEVEKRRQRRKEQAKKRALLERPKHSKPNWAHYDAVLEEFKTYLKRRYGNFIRAWRNVLSPDGAMTLQRVDLFKAVAAIGWPGDVRTLWHAFDRDDSGYAAVEELDPKNAQLMAHFRAFIMERFGSSSAAFRAFDKFNRKKLRQQEFVAALKSFGFALPGKPIFTALDFQSTKAIIEDDLHFLDRWKPPAFLIASANYQAAEDVKATLLRIFKNHLKAWRQALDCDSTNRCNWDEFEAACNRIGFNGDVAGAWRALDDDLSGFITLSEIDPVANDTLRRFKHWANEEFGGVRSAFAVFDSDGSNEVSSREFRRSCRIYGFEGDVHTLFRALDLERSGSLTIKEVAFLDEWEFRGQGSSVDETQVAPVDLARNGSGPLFGVDGEPRRDRTTTQYGTEGRGPVYALPTTVGNTPATPMVRFPGAYSFRKRPAHGLTSYLKEVAEKPAPGDYDDGGGRLGRDCIWQSKPTWVFGTERRKATEVIAKNATPGPGQYGSPKQRTHSAICTPRRPLRVHPLFREAPARLPMSARI